MNLVLVKNDPITPATYNLDYVLKNPGLYEGADTDKSALYNAGGLGIFYGSVGKNAVFSPWGHQHYSSWNSLRFVEIDNPQFKIGNNCLICQIDRPELACVTVENIPIGDFFTMKGHSGFFQRGLDMVVRFQNNLYSHPHPVPYNRGEFGKFRVSYEGLPPLNEEMAIPLNYHFLMEK